MTRKKKPCVFFDLDGTWYRWQIFIAWIEAMVEQGLLPKVVLSRVEKQYRAYKNRAGTFEDYVWALVDSYQGHRGLRGIQLADARRIAQEVIRAKGREVHVFVRELARAAREAGFTLVVISGSPDIVVEAFAKANRVHRFLGTEHPHQNGVYTGGKPKDWFRDKASAVTHLAELHGLDLRRSIAVGDTTSDAGMLGLVGFPIAFNPNRGLLELCHEQDWPIVVERKDVIYLEKHETRRGKTRRVEATLMDLLPAPVSRILKARLIALMK